MFASFPDRPPFTRHIKNLNKGHGLKSVLFQIIQMVIDVFKHLSQCLPRYETLAPALHASHLRVILWRGVNHGVSTSTDCIKIERLEEARRLIGYKFLVLHGGTGMPDQMIQRAIQNGVVKINVSTALKIETMKIRTLFCNNHNAFDVFFEKFMKF